MRGNGSPAPHTAYLNMLNVIPALMLLNVCQAQPISSLPSAFVQEVPGEVKRLGQQPVLVASSDYGILERSCSAMECVLTFQTAPGTPRREIVRETDRSKLGRVVLSRSGVWYTTVCPDGNQRQECELWRFLFSQGRAERLIGRNDDVTYDILPSGTGRGRVLWVGDFAPSASGDRVFAAVTIQAAGSAESTPILELTGPPPTPRIRQAVQHPAGLASIAVDQTGLLYHAPDGTNAGFSA